MSSFNKELNILLNQINNEEDNSQECIKIIRKNLDILINNSRNYLDAIADDIKTNEDLLQECKDLISELKQKHNDIIEGDYDLDDIRNMDRIIADNKDTIIDRTKDIDELENTTIIYRHIIDFANEYSVLLDTISSSFENSIKTNRMFTNIKVTIYVIRTAINTTKELDDAIDSCNILSNLMESRISNYDATDSVKIIYQNIYVMNHMVNDLNDILSKYRFGQHNRVYDDNDRNSALNYFNRINDTSIFVLNTLNDKVKGINKTKYVNNLDLSSVCSLDTMFTKSIKHINYVLSCANKICRSIEYKLDAAKKRLRHTKNVLRTAEESWTIKFNSEESNDGEECDSRYDEDSDEDNTNFYLDYMINSSNAVDCTDTIEL